MKGSPILPILLGLSLCSAGGAYLYIYLKNKRDKRGSTGGGGFGTRGNLFSPDISPSKTFGETEVKFVLSNTVVPLVCGRNGATLKNIEEQTGVVVKFREKDDSNQYCVIRGNVVAVQAAEKLIKKEAARPPTFTQEIIVPQTACGKILGRCGESLDEICRQSLAKVWIDSGSRHEGNERRILITGNQNQVATAKRLIELKVQEDIEFRKLLDENEQKREPRIRSPPASVTETSVPREILPPVVEKLRPTGADGQLEVYVSSVSSPSKFWLQIVGSQSSELDILVDAMTEFYSDAKNQEKYKIRKPYLGQIVAALFNLDNKWYRAEIISIQPNDYSPGDVVLDLYFVDYGDSQYVAPHEVFELRTDFLSLRFQAIECFLANVEPFESDNGKWNQHAISRFEELTHVAQWKKILSKVVILQERKTNQTFKRDGSPIPGVELYDSHNGRDINVAVEMVNENLAQPIPKFGDLEKSHVLNVIDDVKTQTETIIKKTNTPTVVDTKSASINSKPKDNQKNIDKQNVSLPNDNLKNNASTLSKNTNNLNEFIKLTNGNSAKTPTSLASSAGQNSPAPSIVNGTKSFLDSEKQANGGDSENWIDLLDDDEPNTTTNSNVESNTNVQNT